MCMHPGGGYGSISHVTWWSYRVLFRCCLIASDARLQFLCGFLAVLKVHLRLKLSSHCGLCDLSFYIKHYELSIVALQQTGNLFRAYHACGPMSGSSSRPWIGLVDENVFLSTSFFLKIIFTNFSEGIQKSSLIMNNDSFSMFAKRRFSVASFCSNHPCQITAARVLH